MIKLSDQDKIDIVKTYLSGIGSGELATKYQVSRNSICSILKRRSIPRRNRSLCHQKYQINEGYFDTINTEDKAYFLGLLFADGYHNIKKNMIRLFLNHTDQHIIKDFISCLKYNKAIEKRTYSHPLHQDQYGISIFNQHMSNTLRHIGCTQRKSHTLRYPLVIPPDMDRHFIRGYYDGDGSLYLPKVKSRASVDIASTKIFCNTLKNKIENATDVHTNTRVITSNHSTHDIKVGGRKQISKVLNWLYQDANFYLHRKFEKFQLLYD